MNYNFLYDIRFLKESHKRYKNLSKKDKETFDEHNKIFLANQNYINNHKYYRKDNVFIARYNSLCCANMLAKKRALTPSERMKLYKKTEKYVSDFREHERKDD